MNPEIPPADDPRSTRLAHLRIESGIKSVGQLCYLVAFLSVLGTLEFLLVAVEVLPHDPMLQKFATPGQVRGLFWALTAFVLLNAAGQWALGFGLTRLQSWARWTVVALTGLSLVSYVGTGVALAFAYPAWGLLGLLIGGALHALILQPLLSTGAGVVFSWHYKEVIRATPEIRGRMHWLLKLCIGSIVAGVVGLLAYLAALYLRIID